MQLGPGQVDLRAQAAARRGQALRLVEERARAAERVVVGAVGPGPRRRR
ncbi:MAG: hypothetical protein KF878_28255 [Planctomycetes bacterium]|nr:hypothetical protein [Planctomycetota bacterium]